MIPPHKEESTAYYTKRTFEDGNLIWFFYSKPIGKVDIRLFVEFIVDNGWGRNKWRVEKIYQNAEDRVTLMGLGDTRHDAFVSLKKKIQMMKEVLDHAAKII